MPHTVFVHFSWTWLTRERLNLDKTVESSLGKVAAFMRLNHFGDFADDDALDVNRPWDHENSFI